MSSPSYLTVAEVADYLRCHRTQVYDLVKAGKLPALRIGRNAMRIPVAAVDAFEAAHTTGVTR